MVGLTLGLALAQGGLKTLVADAAPPATQLDPAFDGRVSALAYASVRLLKALEVWPALEAKAQPIREILVTDGAVGKAASPFSLHFDAAEVGAPELGAIAENRHIRAAQHQAAALGAPCGGVAAQRLAEGAPMRLQLGAMGGLAAPGHEGSVQGRLRSVCHHRSG